MEVIRSWPKAARKRAGDDLFYIQKRFDPASWRALQGFRAAVREIRIRTDRKHYRIVYIASFGEAVYVLHAFVKKSRATPKQEIEIIRARLSEVRPLRKAERI